MYDRAGGEERQNGIELGIGWGKDARVRDWIWDRLVTEGLGGVENGIGEYKSGEGTG